MDGPEASEEPAAPKPKKLGWGGAVLRAAEDHVPAGQQGSRRKSLAALMKEHARQESAVGKSRLDAVAISTASRNRWLKAVGQVRVNEEEKRRTAQEQALVAVKEVGYSSLSAFLYDYNGLEKLSIAAQLLMLMCGVMYWSLYDEVALDYSRGDQVALQYIITTIALGIFFICTAIFIASLTYDLWRNLAYKIHQHHWSFHLPHHQPKHEGSGMMSAWQSRRWR